MKEEKKLELGRPIRRLTVLKSRGDEGELLMGPRDRCNREPSA